MCQTNVFTLRLKSISDGHRCQPLTIPSERRAVYCKFAAHAQRYSCLHSSLLTNPYALQVMAVISTYSKSADLTTEPPITSFDDNILKSLYERERLGWQAQCALTGHLAWTLIPDFMADLAGCMLQSTYMLGEPREHAYNRSEPVAVAARATYRPRARPLAGLPGMGSPVSMKRRRV